MKSQLRTDNPDFWGILASGACAVHCLIIPILLTGGAFAGLSWFHSAWVEWSFIAAALFFAGWSLLRSYPRHRNIRPLAVAGAGFLLLAAGRFAAGDMEHYWTAAGGILIAAAHVVNWRVRSRDEACVLSENG
jgi:hypothetical protein